jgi:hypothetical protein
MLKIRSMVTMFVFLACTPLLSGQQTIRVNILTHDNGPVPALDGTNFTGYYKGKPVQITSVTRPTSLPRVVILIDVRAAC